MMYCLDVTHFRGKKEAVGFKPSLTAGGGELIEHLFSQRVLGKLALTPNLINM